MVIGGVLTPGGCTNPDKLCDQLEKGGRPTRARAKLEKIVAQQPNHIRARSWLVILLAEEGELKRAAEEAASLQQIAPENYYTLAALCFLRLTKREWPQAQTACDRSLAVSQRRTRDLNAAAAARLKLGRLEEARVLLEEAEKKDPENLNVKLNLGFYFLSRENYDEAIRRFQEVIARDPSSLTAHKNLARAYFDSNRFSEAEAELKTILSLAPDDAETLGNLAIIYARIIPNESLAKQYARRALAAGASGRQAEVLADIAEGRMEALPMEMRVKTGPRPNFPVNEELYQKLFSPPQPSSSPLSGSTPLSSSPPLSDLSSPSPDSSTVEPSPSPPLPSAP